eukprot:UN27417
MKIENALLISFLSVFRNFSQQWRLLRAYAFGRFWQVKTGGIDFLRTFKTIIERSPQANHFVQICQIMGKTLEWNHGPSTESPWTDCRFRDSSTLSSSFNHHQTPVTIIKYVYYAHILNLTKKQLDIKLLNSLLHKLVSTYNIRDTWLILGYHLAGCFWGDQAGCVKYLEYFSQCVGLLLDESNTQHKQLLSLLHGLAFQNRISIIKPLKEVFAQGFDIMSAILSDYCDWTNTEEGQSILELREDCRKKLRSLITPCYPDHSLIEYGSTRLNIDTDSSDLDFAIIPYKIKG